MRTVQHWPPSCGDVAKMEGIRDGSLDFVHASHTLATQDNPQKVLARWLDLLKLGSYAIVTVPNEDLYGKGE